VSLVDESWSAKWHGNVSNAIGICEATEAVDVAMLVEKARNHRWVFNIIEHALGCVARSTGWRSEELESFIRAASERTLPLVHFFERFAQVDRVSGVKCVPWLSTRPGETQIGVRFLSTDNAARDVTILSNPEPIYLEDDFPMVKSRIRRPDF